MWGGIHQAPLNHVTRFSSTRASHTWEWLLANGFLPFSEADKGRTVEIKDGKVRVDDAEQRVRWLGEASPADCAGRGCECREFAAGESEA